MTLLKSPIEFTLPDQAIASAPPEAGGSARDGTRLMVAARFAESIEHDTFERLDRHLVAGDVLVVNTSRTLPAAVDGVAAGGERVRVHFASPLSSGLWTVEIRTPLAGGGTSPGPDLAPQTIPLPGDARIRLLDRVPRTPRLWVAAVNGEVDVAAYLRDHGKPIRYVPGPQLPIDHYQTVFAGESGSAEMPSAARPFTHSQVTRLVSKGITVTPIVLHAGVSSYEADELPGEERFRVPEATATVINALRATGGRAIAVGTTVVRALESVVDSGGLVHPGLGVTDLLVTGETGVRAVDGLLTGWHEPRSSHLRMLEAFLPERRLQQIYDIAIAHGYLWHEFGDELLVLP